jgi:heme exporter protein C
MRTAMPQISLRTLAIAAVAVLGAGYALAFFYAPEDADQGFIQRIFYLHVPLATCALLGFLVAAIHAIRHLRTGDSIHDARSYVSIHLSVIFGVGVLLTGAIWAKGAWGTWWEWREPTLVSFLIVFLLYATYYPLRYAIEDRDRQARYASVFAITAGAFVPLNFLAVRLAEPLIHPRTFSSAGGLPDSMLFAFLVCLVGMALLWLTLVRFELDAKGASADLRRIRRAVEGDGAPPAPVPSIAPVGVSATRAMAPDRLSDRGSGAKS